MKVLHTQWVMNVRLALLGSKGVSTGIVLRQRVQQCLRLLDLRKQLADFERSIKPMGDAIPIGQLICMALRYRSDQKGYPQLALQSL